MSSDFNAPRRAEPRAGDASSVYRRPLARFNVGGTLQSSMGPRYRRRSTAATGPVGPSAAVGFLDIDDAQQRRRVSMQATHLASVHDGESVNYDVGDLFEIVDGPAPVVARTNSESLAGARLSALTAQRATAEGDLQPPPTKRQMVGMYLDASAAGRRWDQLDAALNVCVAALHVYNTTNVTKHHLEVPQWSLVAEALISVLFLAQFIPRYMLAPDPLEYLRSQFSIISLISGLTPIAVVIHGYLDPSIYGTFMSAGPWVFLYPVIFWRLQPALLRCLVPVKNIYRMSPMTRNVMRALTTVFTTVLAITVLTHIMVYYQNKDKNGEIQGFDEALFFIAVSAITGLSSDIEPDTWFTRGIVLFVMFIGIFWLPPRVSEMLSLWQDRSPWPSSFEAEANQMHVLVIGDLEYAALFEFLREFFCEDHGIRTVNTVVVVMSETSPGKEVAELLADPAYVNRVKFVLGSPTSFAQLAKVQTRRAQAVFILSSKAGADAAKEDAAKVMVALAVRKYLRSNGDPKRPVPIYAQVLLPETTVHLEYLADHVICVEELRLGLLAKSVLVPGFASLLQLLTATIPGNTTDPLVRAAMANRQPWLAEYAASMAHEIYATRLAPQLTGLKFPRAAQRVFQRTGATLFAIRVPERDGSEARLLINPASYVLVGDELGFVIASDTLVSMNVAYMDDQAALEVADTDADAEGPSETAPLISSIPVQQQQQQQAAGGDHVHLAGSPLQRRLAAAEVQLKFKAPFGSNVMDTVVVSEAPHSRRGSVDGASITSALSRASRAHLAHQGKGGNDGEEVEAGAPHAESDGEHDLIDLHGSVLSPELAAISVEDSHPTGRTTNDSDHSDSGGASDSRLRLRRAPLVFDPQQQQQHQQKTTTTDSGPPSRNSPHAEDATSSASAIARAASQPRIPVEPTADGLPGDLSGHVVVCDTSAEFPGNIVYLVSCIRAAAPSEIASSNSGTPTAEETTAASTPAAPITVTVTPPTNNPFVSLYEQISRSYVAAPRASENTTKDEVVPEKETKGSGFLNMQPIVILAPEGPSDQQREDLERFGNLYIVSGSPLQRADLARVRIHRAASAIVLANREETLAAAADPATRLSLAGSDTTATATADAPALLSVLNIEALTWDAPDFFLSVEFIHRENMQFVGDGETLVINEVYAQAFLRPSFMAGRVYAPYML
ncbi:hypothetical protein GGI07_002728 [Coemansia sp. Benny D115]|nr:hypothetical protein GGI07_002728 [Coemansia sp. Benny D115]